MRKELTESQKKLYDFIIKFQMENNFAPTFKQMGGFMGTSISNVQQRLYVLERKKMLRKISTSIFTTEF